MSGVGNPFNIPHYIKAGSPSGLLAKMLQNNLDLKAECQYFQITFNGKEWFAWYYNPAKEQPSLIKKSESE